VDPALLKLIKSKADSWCRELMDFTKRNRLLFFKQLKKGTLNLTAANPGAISDLLAGRQVSIRKLFPNLDEAQATEIRDRLRTIQAKKRENEEERSIETLHLAVGEVTWDDSDGSATRQSAGLSVPPAAPLFLVPLKISTSQGREDYVLTAAVDDFEVNPVLVEYLRSEYKFDLVPNQDAADDEDETIASLAPILKQRLSSLRGGRLNDSHIIGNFSYAKLAMVKDIQEDLISMSQHTMIQALCSIEEAIASIRGHYVDPPLDQPNHVSPADEFLILDADSSQNKIVNAIIDGRSFAFDGPPGTGKSQTIANAIGAMVARGKSVLFVAEKRAAIDVVIRRLNDVGLGELVMDFHGTGHKKKELLDKIRTVLPLLQQGRSLSYEAVDLEASRSRLVEHSDKLHRKLDSVGLSPYELISLRSEHETSGNVGFILSGAGDMSMDEVRALEAEMRRFNEQGGFVGGKGAAMWRRLTGRDLRNVEKHLESLEKIRKEALRDLGTTEKFLDSLNSSAPRRFREAVKNLPTLSKIAKIQERFGSALFAADIPHLQNELARAQGLVTSLFLGLGSKSVRNARKQIRLLSGRRLSTRSAAQAVSEVAKLLSEWESLGFPKTAIPDADVNSSMRRVVDAWVELETLIENIAVFPELIGAKNESLIAVEQMVADLLSFGHGARNLSEAHSTEASLTKQGLDRLIKIARERVLTIQSTCSAVWLSWLDTFIGRDAMEVLKGSQDNLESLTSAALVFAHSDTQHIGKTPNRILDTWREHYRETVTAHERQDKALSTALNRKRKVPPLKDIFRDSQDVICAIKPVWVMSPLSVSMLRPKAGTFDVVIFDEASQILPWDAITAIKASRQVVVAGDDQQLPPTTFFAGGDREEEPQNDNEETEDEVELPDFESILAFMKSVVTKPLSLQWHYRSRDERLINYSNKKIYQSLITFADSASESVIKFVKVPDVPDNISKNASNAAEVEVVCGLIAEHAKDRPNETLGVIALGTNHADAIEAEIRRRCEHDTKLDAFLQAHSQEPFFVKNLERVQGDERDAIILTVGYGRGPDKQIRYTFGPINGKYGVRRLNVATTRSRNRMTAVATFTANELKPEMCTAGGLEFLRGYLKYAESGGVDIGTNQGPVAMNAFERSIFDRLTAAGLEVEPQYGVGSYRIDFAVRSRKDRSKFALAVECDGASYHSQPTARERDRLRQAALERRGWRFHRIWSTDWFNDPEKCVQEVLKSLQLVELQHS
jgi:very-short-patch-repair endonuclease